MSEHTDLGPIDIPGLGTVSLSDLFGGGSSYQDPIGGGLHGDPDVLAGFWVAQTQNYDCVEMSAADMIGQVTGQEPGEMEITQVAQTAMVSDPVTGQQHAVYDPNSGSRLADMPALLAEYGVSSHYSEGNDMHSLENALDNGQAVTASVDGPRIWNAVDNDNETDPNTHDHAVVVTGVDESQGVVYLNDSGTPNGQEEVVPISVFESAWGTSNDAMVTTDAQPAGDPGYVTVDPAHNGPAQSPVQTDPWTAIFGELGLLPADGVKWYPHR